MTFREIWYLPQGLVALEHAFEQVAGIDGQVIEVGSWEGRSTVVLARAAYPDTVHAVDTWQGSPGEESGELAAEPGRDVYAQFVENMHQFTLGNVSPHRMSWRDYFQSDLAPIRFLHIDAEHTYREVFDNIEAARPLMVPGGVICGDDAHHPPVIEAACNALGSSVIVDASLWMWRNTDGC